MAVTRRDVLTGVLAAAASGMVGRALAGQGRAERRLTAAPARVALVGSDRPETAVWAYDGEVPGPVLRFRQGERVRIVVENRLPGETTVHWHGLRVPNAMDGVPHLTQPPIPPGGQFVYEFDLPDAGTFWYHPHVRSHEQVERGLAGAFIVEERTPPDVDRDIVWVIDDWRLTPEAEIAPDFDAFFDASHAGRLGNTVTVNGRLPTALAVRRNERLRLRLVNVSNARILGLVFEGHVPTVIALDGQPVAPHAPAGGRIVLGPAMRADIVLDMTAEPGRSYAVLDTFYPNGAYRLTDITYEKSAPVRPRPLTAAVALPANPIPAPELDRAERHTIEFGGGMMDPKLMRAMQAGSLSQADVAAVRERMRAGRIWTINGQSVLGHAHEPLLTLRRGRSYVLALRNETAWHHPMHLHGTAFHVVSRNGRPLLRRVLQDTILMAPGETAEIAFVADEPGDWMFHCHILEHQAAGMMGTFRIS
ncbi:MAG TPA: multicopper oxidase family protein [Alphaproteobacteria bacterium]